MEEGRVQDDREVGRGPIHRARHDRKRQRPRARSILSFLRLLPFEAWFAPLQECRDTFSGILRLAGPDNSFPLDFERSLQQTEHRVVEVLFYDEINNRPCWICPMRALKAASNWTLYAMEPGALNFGF
jgi:hypothetical protein